MEENEERKDSNYQRRRDDENEKTAQVLVPISQKNVFRIGAFERNTLKSSGEHDKCIYVTKSIVQSLETYVRYVLRVVLAQ